MPSAVATENAVGTAVVGVIIAVDVINTLSANNNERIRVFVDLNGDGVAEVWDTLGHEKPFGGEDSYKAFLLKRAGLAADAPISELTALEGRRAVLKVREYETEIDGVPTKGRSWEVAAYLS